MPTLAQPPVVVTPSRRGDVDFETWLTEALAAEGDSEWVAGKVIHMAPAADGHQSANGRLLNLLTVYVEDRDLGRVGFDMAVRLPQRPSGRVPDVFFVARDRLGIIGPTYLDGPPDLAVEIISRDSTDRDWRDKFDEYQAAGVAEYLIVDPFARALSLYRLKDGRYVKVEPDGGRLRFEAVPGFWLEEAWLFGEPPVKISAALAALASGT